MLILAEDFLDDYLGEDEDEDEDETDEDDEEN